MSDARNSSAPFVPAAENLGSSQFDDSIFEKVAMSLPDRREDRDDEPDCDYEDEPPSARGEGLPPSFRMRHDAHYVEELVSRNLASCVALREEPVADASDEAEPERPSPVPGSVSQACAELGQSLDAIGACLRLFPAASRSASESMALGLIDAEVARASWLVQALALLDEPERPVANVATDLAASAGRVVQLLSVGSPVALTLDAGDDVPRIRGDATLVTLAVAGMVMALQAVAARVPGAAISVALRHEQGHAIIHVVQDSVKLPASWRARFLDPAWADRPGGRRVTVALAASRRAAELHDGVLTIEHDERGGCRLVLSLPTA